MRKFYVVITNTQTKVQKAVKRKDAIKMQRNQMVQVHKQ